MPYLQLDLEAKKRIPRVAKLLGVQDCHIGWGLIELWDWCWNEKKTSVSRLMLGGFFGQISDNLPSALAEFGFLEALEDGQFRVRGADRYLRIVGAQSEAGKKHSGNLKKGKKSPGSSPALAGGDPERVSGSPSGSSPALTPNTEHRTPIKEKNYLVDKPSVSSTAPGILVFEYWCEKFGKTQAAKFNSRRRSAVTARLKEGYSEEQLKLAVDGCALTPHNMGQNDRGERYDDLELICRTGSQVERFIQNATSPPLSNGKLNLAHETSDEEFRRKTAHLKTTADGLFILE